MNTELPHHPTRFRRRWRLAAASLMLAGATIIGAFAWGEAAGWPWLAAPLERALSRTLDRRVDLGIGIQAQGSASAALRVSLLGGLRLQTPRLEIAAPPWSQAPWSLRADGVVLELRYIDLWRARRGQALHVARLQARSLDGRLERLADGRASWLFIPAAVAADAQQRTPPRFDQLRVDRGTLSYQDLLLDLKAEAQFSMADGELPALQLAARPDSSASSATATGAVARPAGPVFTLTGNGHYQGRPLKVEFASAGVLPWVAVKEPATAVPLTLRVRLGRASLSFQGSAVDAFGLNGLKGHFSVDGPSLAAVGSPIGVTLPTTTAFHTEGELDKQGHTWRVAFRSATVGLSRLDGDFVYQGARTPPLLTGRLGGARLMLADLGPAIGTTPLDPLAGPASAAVPTSATAARQRGKEGKVLPARPFDLASLRAMDADVQIDISEADLNMKMLEPLQPLQGRLTLSAGVLTLGALDARAAGGRLTGDVKLDGRGPLALWNADLRWDGIRLEQWLRQARADGAPPYVSGQLSGRVLVEGQGISTAAILARMKGTLHTELRDGTVSHLLVEKAGIDIAESLRLLVKGDESLQVSCAVADLVAEGGVLRPRVMVVDTTDSTILVDGSLSLASERLDLRAVVSPKDFSPMTLRTPLRVTGSFSQPKVSLHKGPMAARLVGAIVLAQLNPLAALVPMIDLGNAGAAERGSEGCRRLAQRAATAAARPAPGKSAPAPTTKARP
jgi:uncharacterized protein involved in outer membrane biogenesis